MTGIDVLKVLNERELKTKVVMISAVGQQSAIAEGLAQGAVDYLVKPFDNNELLDILEKLKND